MAKASNKLSTIFTILLLVSLLSLGSLTRARKLPVKIEPTNLPALGEAAVAREGGSQAIHHETFARGLAAISHVQAMTESTTPGHSPGVGHLTSKSEDFQPTEPGHSPGAGHSTGPEVVRSPSRHL
ncbi:hypothetical protein SAY87_010360 [Trapa incisa]|uniref:Uncharacterized protein n=2 Tax=Trapa TaxID=22665 RepID=A0AAN7ME97_TRANT|nr:hypothetical protein SAY87_010360 [Trapa incisa]KAK4795280.1 hypothetical protein SAY86_013274 [Trapa natans]